MNTKKGIQYRMNRTATQTLMLEKRCRDGERNAIKRKGFRDLGGETMTEMASIRMLDLTRAGSPSSMTTGSLSRVYEERNDRRE